MATTSVQLAEPLQALIDSRLDTIDRMLLGSVARQDRLAIVKDVETQIYELLQDRDTGELDREDVLAVLRRLDPPEAYLAEETGREPAAVRGLLPIAMPARKQDPQIARLAGILGLIALSLILVISPVLLALAYAVGSELCEFGCFGAAFLGFVVSVVGLVVGVFSRRSGVWAVVGMVTSVIALVLSFRAGALFMLQILN
jgi:hypothetical protein